MMSEGVGETQCLSDALGVFDDALRINSIRAQLLLAALRRLLQALQYFGQVMPFSTLPAAFASFHSAPHFF